MIGTIRRAIDEKGRLPVEASSLAADENLYRAGLTPFAAIQVMLALEQEVSVEFPKSMLELRSMSSIGAILSCLLRLQAAETRRAA